MAAGCCLPHISVIIIKHCNHFIFSALLLTAAVFFCFLFSDYCCQYGMFQSPYAQLLAATTLTKLISRPNVTLPLEQRIDIRM